MSTQQHLSLLHHTFFRGFHYSINAKHLGSSLCFPLNVNRWKLTCVQRQPEKTYEPRWGLTLSAAHRGSPKTLLRLFLQHVLPSTSCLFPPLSASVMFQLPSIGFPHPSEEQQKGEFRGSDGISPDVPTSTDSPVVPLVPHTFSWSPLWKICWLCFCHLSFKHFLFLRP